MGRFRKQLQYWKVHNHGKGQSSPGKTRKSLILAERTDKSIVLYQLPQEFLIRTLALEGYQNLRRREPHAPGSKL